MRALLLFTLVVLSCAWIRADDTSTETSVTSETPTMFSTQGNTNGASTVIVPIQDTTEQGMASTSVPPASLQSTAQAIIDQSTDSMATDPITLEPIALATSETNIPVNPTTTTTATTTTATTATTTTATTATTTTATTSTTTTTTPRLRTTRPTPSNPTWKVVGGLAGGIFGLGLIGLGVGVYMCYHASNGRARPRLQAFD